MNLNKEVIKQVSQNLNLPKEIVYNIYNSYWQFIKETISKLPLNTIKTEEDFLKLRTNFNIPFIGKLYCTYDSLLGRNKRIKHIKTKVNAKNKKN
jgi:hypothetical protein